MLGLGLGSAEQRRSCSVSSRPRPIPSRPCAWLGSFCSGILIYKHNPDCPCSTQKVSMEGSQLDLCATSCVVMYHTN